MSDETAELRSLEETARFFDISVPTLRAWIKDGCPVDQHGGNGVAYQLDLLKVGAWRRSREQAQRQEAEQRAARDQQLRMDLLGSEALGANDETTLTATARAAAMREELDRTKLAELRRELVSAADTKLLMAQVFGQLRMKIRNIPDELGDEFGLSESQQEAMLDRIDEALTDIADSIEAIASSPQEGAARAA